MVIMFFTVTCILLTCAAVVVVRSAAQIAPSQPPAEGPGGAGDCSTLIYDMMDCMTFLIGDDPNPDASCCSGLKTVVDADVECICYAMNTAASLGMDLNMTKAITMPDACGVYGVPPINTCTDVNPLPPSTTQPPSASDSSPAGAPAALSPVAPPPPPPSPPADNKKKSGTYTIAAAATSSTLFTILASFSLLFSSA